MKIKEDDFLWKMYNRYYKGCNFVEPKSICPYFWKAMGGFVLYLFADVAFYIMMPVLVTLTLGYVYILSQLGNSTPSWVFFASMVPACVLFLSCLVLPVGRFASWMETRSKRTHKFMFFGMVVPMLLFFGYKIITEARWQDPDWGGFLTAMSMIGGMFLIVLFVMFIYHCIVRPVAVTRFGQQLALFFKSIKNGVCPMVELPDNYKKVENAN